jgi:hypothetical protein
MSWPTLAVECAFGSDASNASPSWQDITDYVREVRIRRGRQFELDRIDASTLALKLDNSDRRFDPSYVSGPYYPNVLPMRRVRVRAAAFGPGSALTTSGNEITDALRALGVQGDGRSSDSSFGIWRGVSNPLTNSGFETNAAGWATQVGTESLGAPAATGAKFGTKALPVTTPGGVGSEGVRSNSVTVTAAQTHTASIYVSGSGTVALSLNERDAADANVGETVGTSTVLTATPQRLTVSRAFGGTGVKARLKIVTQGAQAVTFYVDAAQIDQNSLYATPYHHRDDAASAYVARGAGRVQAPVSLMGTTQGWFAARVRLGWSSAAVTGLGAQQFAVAEFGNLANTEGYELFYRAGTGDWRLRAISGGASVGDAQKIVAHNAGDIVTIIGYYKAGEIAVSVNGGAFTKAVPASTPAIVAGNFDIGNFSTGSQFDGDVLWLACGTGTLTDADAATIHANLTTTPRPNGVNANGDASLLTLPTAAAATMVWYADTSIPTVPTTYDLFNGFVERWPPSFDRPQQQFVNVTATDGFAALAQAIVSGSFPQEFSGARISRVLTAASWIDSVAATGYWTLGTSLLGTTTRLSYGIPTTVLDTGRTEIPAVTYADTDEQTALAHIQDVADSELGVFFIDGAGRAIFHDRNHRTRTTTSSVVFTDGTTSTSRLTYADISPSFDGDRIANDIRVTRSGGVTQPATDPMSITKYLRRTLPRAPLLTSDVEAANQAGYLLRSMKDPYLRFDSITVEPMLTDDAWPHALGREISDRVTVELTPPMVPGGTIETISKDCFVEAIEHRLEPPFTWQTTYQLSPADTASFWTLGSSQLGASTVLAY